MSATAPRTDPENGTASNAGEIVRLSARAYERDRYLSALLCPRSARDDLVVIAAFAGELRRIPAYVSEPMLGAIRLQWWRDALAAGRADQTIESGHPIADAMADVARRHAIPAHLIAQLIDAIELSLEPAPIADDSELDTYLDRTDGALFAMSARILAVQTTDATNDCIVDAGRAYGIARLVAEAQVLAGEARTLLPQSALLAAGTSIERLAAGQDWQCLDDTFIAMERLSISAVQRIRARRPSMPTSLRRALLPVALVKPYFRVSRHGRAKGRTEAADIMPLTRVWCLLSAALSGRL